MGFPHHFQIHWWRTAPSTDSLLIEFRTRIQTPLGFLPCNPPGSSASSLSAGTRAPPRGCGLGAGRSRPGGRSLWSGGRCVVIRGATAGGCCVGPGGAFGFGVALPGVNIDGRDGSPQVLPVDLGAVSLPQRSGEGASGGWARGQRWEGGGPARRPSLHPGAWGPSRRLLLGVSRLSVEGRGAGHWRTPWRSEWERTHRSPSCGQSRGDAAVLTATAGAGPAWLRHQVRGSDALRSAAPSFPGSCRFRFSFWTFRRGVGVPLGPPPGPHQSQQTNLRILLTASAVEYPCLLSLSRAASRPTPNA